MITKINLLPQEYRRKEMTPMRVFLPVVASMALVVAGGFFWGWLHFAALAGAVSERDSQQAVYDSKKPTLTYLASLKTEEGVYKQRADTIAEIAASRTLWTRKLDQLCDVIADDDQGARYLIRMDSLEVKQPNRTRRRGRKKGTPPGETIKLKGFCFNDEDPLQHFNIFHESIKQSQFFIGEFLSISNPQGEVQVPDADLRPQRAWTVDLEMVMRGKDPKQSKGRKGRNVRATGN